jgi:hypothetical protein
MNRYQYTDSKKVMEMKILFNSLETHYFYVYVYLKRSGNGKIAFLDLY